MGNLFHLSLVVGVVLALCFSPGALASLRSGVQSELSCAKSKYAKVQFLSFQINTYFDTLRGEKYTGVEDDEEELENRLKIMKAAVDKAYTQADKSSSILKVFQAPEFFFRGKSGAFDMELAMRGVINGLRLLVKDNKYQHFLFVFGTSIGKSNSINTASHSQLYNMAIAMRGGANGAFWIVPKHHISGADFVGGKRKDETYGDPAAVDNSELRHEFKAHVVTAFETDGIYFGVDVCKDHSAQYTLFYNAGRCDEGHFCDTGIQCIAGQCQAYYKRPKCLPQIQLIPAGGSFIMENSVAVVEGGYVMLTDGFWNSMGRQLLENDAGFEASRTEVIKVTGPNENLGRGYGKDDGVVPFYDYLALFQAKETCKSHCDPSNPGNCGKGTDVKLALAKKFDRAARNAGSSVADVCKNKKLNHAIQAEAVSNYETVGVYKDSDWCAKIRASFYTRDCASPYKPLIQVYGPAAIPATRRLL